MRPAEHPATPARGSTTLSPTEVPPPALRSPPPPLDFHRSPPTVPSLAVIVPFHDAPHNLERCLAGLRASALREFELILVDDASSDPRSIALARDEPGARVHRMERNSGPAGARNAGVALTEAEIVAFIDSDCVVHADTLGRMRAAFRETPDLGALFGSYDDQPASPGIVSEYRNLLHHYVHHTGPKEATTWWAGCGAIRRDLFERVGGFDAETFPRPMIEDIELGMRMKSAGASIHLLPEIQVKHLKRWRFVEMVKVDVTCRAVPWTRLLIDRPATGGDLNLEKAQKLCVALVFLAVGALVGLPLLAALGFAPWWSVAAAPVALLLPVLWMNRGLYGLFLRRKGPLFALAGVGLHLLYFLYGGLGFLWAHATHRGKRPDAATA